VSGLSVGVVLVARTGKVLWLNRTAEHLLGMTFAESSGRPFQQVVRTPQIAAFWQDTRRKDENAFAELAVQWPREMELKVNATRCLDGDGRELGRALLVCDMTHERAVQVQLTNAVANRLLALTGSHVPPKPVSSLTQQELRILRMVAEGMGNDMVAEEMKISASTVRSHLKSLYKKLDLGSRTEAVSFAIRYHLI
jgi:DNA-binding CsgD family transcriptional regulator